jgi:hypothetical protein
MRFGASPNPLGLISSCLPFWKQDFGLNALKTKPYQQAHRNIFMRIKNNARVI